MNKFTTAVLGAEWEPTTDDDMILRHLRLLDELHHEDDATPDELAYRIRTARNYIRRSCRRFRGQSRKLTVLTHRLLAVSILFLLLACVMAILFG